MADERMKRRGQFAPYWYSPEYIESCYQRALDRVKHLPILDLTREVERTIEFNRTNSPTKWSDEMNRWNEKMQLEVLVRSTRSIPWKVRLSPVEAALITACSNEAINCLGIDWLNPKKRNPIQFKEYYPHDVGAGGTSMQEEIGQYITFPALILGRVVTRNLGILNPLYRQWVLYDTAGVQGRLSFNLEDSHASYGGKGNSQFPLMARKKIDIMNIARYKTLKKLGENDLSK